MLLKLKNVGRLKSAEVKIDGLTVICGNNNTGKSTVGKILYCIYDSLHDIDESVREDKIKALKRCVEYAVSSREKVYDFMPAQILECIYETVDKGSTGEAIVNMLGKAYDIKTFGSEAHMKELSDRINLILETSIGDMVSNFIMRRLDAEFGQKIGNVNHPRTKASVELKIKDDSISFYSLEGKNRLVLEKYFSLHKNIIYIDDPFMMDDINSYRYVLFAANIYGHRNKLIATLAKRAEQTSVEEIIGNQKLDQIIASINSISDGELVLENRKFAYKHSGLRESLSLRSVSTGIKTFIIVKKLLQDGMLEENGIIVFDEPEVHLHPEWQIKFAEIIVMLQKAYGLNIVLTTHSMDFLSAIDHFSQQHGIERVCNYYLTELEKTRNADDFPSAVMRDVTDDKEKLYASISQPFLSLYKQMSD